MAPGTGPVGFVGLGNMGRLMAANLAAAAFPLVVRDSDPAAERRFTDAHGGTVASGRRSRTSASW